MTLTATNLPLPLLRRGKVRDVYAVDADRILVVATDRISAFDWVLQGGIPRKGVVLTQLSAWWFRKLESEIRHHMLSSDVDEIIAVVPALAEHRQELDGRAMLCRAAQVFPVECVIRGYISGSAWKEYEKHGTLAGEPLPRGLRESDRLPEPLLSPATKAETGHDENITMARMLQILGDDTSRELERLTRRVYASGAAVAARRGIIIADTKLEFGADSLTQQIILIDEVLTPDSSRFWPAHLYQPGSTQPSLDKQPVRDYLDAERREGRWNGAHPPPRLPEDVVTATSNRYLEIFRRLTGAELDHSASP